MSATDNIIGKKLQTIPQSTATDLFVSNACFDKKINVIIIIMFFFE